MVFLFPDIEQLRQKRKNFENFWLAAVKLGQQKHQPAPRSDLPRPHPPARKVCFEPRSESLKRKSRSETLYDEVHAQTTCMEHVDDPTLVSTLLRLHRNKSDLAELDFSMLQCENKRLEPHGGALVTRVLATNRTVKRLIIRDQDIGDEGAIALAEALRSNNSLEYIDLYGNNITDAGVEALAVALYGNESVIHLALWSNSITNRGAIALAAALRCNRRLVYLGLVHNQITRDGAQALLDALEVNVHLETLNLATNRVPPSVISAIRVALARNRIEAPVWRRSHELAEEEATKLQARLVGHEVCIKKDEDTCSETSSEVSDTSGFLSCSDDEEALIWDDFNGTEMWI